jgi:hypothetical protein
MGKMHCNMDIDLLLWKGRHGNVGRDPQPPKYQRVQIQTD